MLCESCNGVKESSPKSESSKWSKVCSCENSDNISQSARSNKSAKGPYAPNLYSNVSPTKTRYIPNGSYVYAQENVESNQTYYDPRTSQLQRSPMPILSNNADTSSMRMSQQQSTEYEIPMSSVRGPNGKSYAAESNNEGLSRYSSKAKPSRGESNLDERQSSSKMPEAQYVNMASMPYQNNQSNSQQFQCYPEEEQNLYKDNYSSKGAPNISNFSKQLSASSSKLKSSSNKLENMSSNANYLSASRGQIPSSIQKEQMEQSKREFSRQSSNSSMQKLKSSSPEIEMFSTSGKNLYSRASATPLLSSKINESGKEISPSNQFNAPTSMSSRLMKNSPTSNFNDKISFNARPFSGPNDMSNYYLSAHGHVYVLPENCSMVCPDKQSEDYVAFQNTEVQASPSSNRFRQIEDSSPRNLISNEEEEEFVAVEEGYTNQKLSDKYDDRLLSQSRTMLSPQQLSQRAVLSPRQLSQSGTKLSPRQLSQSATRSSQGYVCDKLGGKYDERQLSQSKPVLSPEGRLSEKRSISKQDTFSIPSRKPSRINENSNMPQETQLYPRVLSSNEPVPYISPLPINASNNPYDRSRVDPSMMIESSNTYFMPRGHVSTYQQNSYGITTSPYQRIIDNMFSQLNIDNSKSIVIGARSLVDQIEDQASKEQKGLEDQILILENELMSNQNTIQSLNNSVCLKQYYLDNVVDAWAMSKRKTFLLRVIFKWRTYAANRVYERQGTKMVQLFREHRLSYKVINKWHRKVREGYQRALENESRKLVEDQVAIMTSTLSRKAKQAEDKMKSAKTEISDLKNELKDNEEKMRRALMRGVCALNMEAMTYLQNGGIPFLEKSVCMKELSEEREDTDVYHSRPSRNVGQTSQLSSPNRGIEEALQSQEYDNLYNQQPSSSNYLTEPTISPEQYPFSQRNVRSASEKGGIHPMGTNPFKYSESNPPCLTKNSYERLRRSKSSRRRSLPPQQYISVEKEYPPYQKSVGPYYSMKR